MLKDAFRLVIVTGMSGSGKAQVRSTLEDLGYFCVDNLPPVFIPNFIELCQKPHCKTKKVALIIDLRSGEFFDDFAGILQDMSDNEQPYELLFMDANDSVIINRYKENRRKHPLAPEARISEGITLERELLANVRNKATYIIDTSSLRKNELKEKIIRYFGDENRVRMNITVVSFGFKYGMPLDADMVFDVRFLPNPFYIEKLRYKSGAVKEVADYISKWPVTQEFIDKMDNLINFLIPQYIQEGKGQFVLAVGCTGGMHRSVFIAAHLYALLKKHGFVVNLEHRDLMKNKVKEHC